MVYLISQVFCVFSSYMKMAQPAETCCNDYYTLTIKFQL